MTPEQEQKVAELLELEKNIYAWEDDPIGPYIHDDGTPYTMGRQAPAKHPRRCQAARYGDRKRCQRWACIGRKYCQFHGGATSLVVKGQRNRIPVSYRDALMPTLAQRLHEYSNSDNRAEALELYEEIGMSRVLAQQMIGLMNAACDPTKTIALETQLSTIRLAQEAMNHVGELVTKMARIARDKDDAVNVKVLGFFVHQLINVIYDKMKPLGEQGEVIAKQIAQAIGTDIKLPGPDNFKFDPKEALQVEVSYE